jgi:hypothetical protein
MSIPSSLYAEKIFAEQPLALWPMDEKLDYASMLLTSQRNLLDPALWSVSGGTVESTSEQGPMSQTTTYRLVADGSLGGKITLTGPELSGATSMDQDLGSFSIGLFLYSETSFVTSIDIGYKVGDSQPVFKNSSFTLLQTWRQVSKTFDIPSGTISSVRPVIRINYTVEESQEEYPFLINGITAGQWSEQFSLESTGVELIQIPNTIGLSQSSWGYPIDSYGAGQNGYYLGSRTALSAKNFGVPMIYGSQSVTTLRGDSEKPSIIIPAYGFLNNLGQFRNSTLEFWLRVNSQSSSIVPIVKAMGSSDGLYIDGPFIIIKIGNLSASHFVGDWGRPMLIDFIFTSSFASLMINSEQVLSVQFDSENLSLASHLSPSGKNQDWLEFYSHEEVGPVQIDCVAIYPYQVPALVAKRRMVYAQAVDAQENTNSSYTSSAVNINYFSSQYSNNYNYPDVGRWDSGIVNNFVLTRDSMDLPRYPLPTVSFQNRSSEDWIEDLAEGQGSESPWISLRPSSDWNSENAYMFFDKINILNKPTSAVYGLFEKNSLSEQILLKLVDIKTKNYLQVSSQNNSVFYKFYSNGVEAVVAEKTGYLNNSPAIVGIDLDDAAKNFGGLLGAFLNNKKNLELYVGGDASYGKTFSGKIHSLSFSNKQDLSSTTGIIGQDGLIYVSDIDDVYGDDDLNANVTNASYSLSLLRYPLSRFGYELAVGAHASWQDYVPLTYLSKYVKNAANENYYSMDFVQVNFDYPLPPQGDLSYDTESQQLRAYVTFQILGTNPAKPLSSFTNAVSASTTGVVEPGTVVVGTSSGKPVYDSFMNTKYEIINGMIVYPPATIPLDKIAMVVHFEVRSQSVARYPVGIRSLELASLALNDIAENPVGTDSGVPIFPYTKLNIYFDYKKRNPFEIYKGNTPYLYLTRNSGVRLKGQSSVGLSRGISIPINQGKASTYSVGAIQFAFRYDEDLFPEQAVELFEIEASNAYIKYYLVASDSSRKRGRVYGIDTSTGAVYQGMGMFLNGVLSRETIIDSKEWTIMGIQFTTFLNFSNYVGAIRITGPILANNIYHYQFASYQEEQTVKTRQWINVLNTAEGTAKWEDYEELTWLDVLFILTTAKTSIDPARLYRVYTGTNKFVTGDDKSMSFTDYRYRVLSSISWQTDVLDAV